MNLLDVELQRGGEGVFSVVAGVAHALPSATIDSGGARSA